MNTMLLRRIGAITDEELQILRGERTINRSLYPASGDFVIAPDSLPAHRLKGENRQVALRTHTRFVEFPLHGHDFVEVMYVCQGSITHIIDGETVILGEGDLLLLNTHVRHKIRPASRDDIAVNLILTVDFFSTFLEPLHSSPPLYEFALENLRRDGQPRFLHYHIGDIPPVTNLMENLVYSLVAEQSTPQSIFRRTMELMLSYLVFYPDTLCKHTAPVQKNDAMHQQILSYIESNYATASLSDLSKRMGFSVQYLSEWISANLGSSFKSMLQDKRFTTAQRLLLTTNLSVSEIMAAVGYENSSYFHRRFRERYGVTPLAFRSGAKS